MKHIPVSDVPVMDCMLIDRWPLSSGSSFFSVTILGSVMESEVRTDFYPGSIEDLEGVLQPDKKDSKFSNLENIASLA